MFSNKIREDKFWRGLFFMALFGIIGELSSFVPLLWPITVACVILAVLSAIMAALRFIIWAVA